MCICVCLSCIKLFDNVKKERRQKRFLKKTEIKKKRSLEIGKISSCSNTLFFDF